MLKRLRTLFFLFLICLITSAPALAEFNENNEATVFFSSQLNPNAQTIYKELSDSFTSKKMIDGKTPVDLFGKVSSDLVTKYVNDGDRTLFNDFAAAKDAFDLQHPEAWYIDSSFLCLRVVKKGEELHPLIGPGRDETYYLDGQDFSESEIETKNTELTKEIDRIVSKANEEKGTSDDARANKVKIVHNEITKNISYRFENECKKDTKNSYFIRTAYGLITHEGVCESYARSFQMCMNKLGIPCVIIMGMQTSGDSPEQHMWTAVKIGQTYYVVDPTWDDPIKTDSKGNPVLVDKQGVDGCEHSRYLLVGTDSTPNWMASGKVSASPFEFQYPAISSSDFSGGTAFGNDDGLKVQYTSAAEVDGAPAGLFTITYKNKGIVEAGKNGYHLLVKMYDNHPDGTSHSIDNWYYVEAGLKIMNFNGKNQYFEDNGECLKMFTAGCEYVEYALTTREPEEFDKWDLPVNQNPLSDPKKDVGYYHGDGSDIFSETGKLYNVNSSYEAAPYVYRQYPSSTQQVNTGEYDAKVIYDDSLNLEQNPAQSPTKTKRPGEEGPTSESGSGDPYAKYKRVPESQLNYYKDDVKVHYQCTQLDVDGNRIPYTLQGEVKFDSNKDGFVDPENVTWLFDCTNDSHTHNWRTCKLVGVEFKFDSSPLWADDTTLYTFDITNVYGSRSNKEPNTWGYLVSAPTCPFSYRSQGIDWNLWGRPSLLDNPNDIDLSSLSCTGVDGHTESLEQLQKDMNLERLNGRLTLVVEDLSKQREKVEELEETLKEKKGIDEKAIDNKSLYEINFNRMCNKTLKEINDGDSMRIQVGFPPGFDANSNVVFKAYHFTRDDNGTIISVEEIPIMVTEYGLVVMCDSFSPFELVALNPEKAPSVVSETNNIKVAVVGDGNTNIKIDNTEVNDSNSLNVEFSPNQTHTFTFTPKDDSFQVEGIKLVGLEKTLDENNSVEVSYEELATAFNSKTTNPNGISTILSVTSVPTSVVKAEGAAVQEKACTHTNIKPTKDPKPAICTEDGLIPAKTCSDCGAVIEQEQTIPKLGHEYDLTNAVEKEATCTEAGRTKAVKCLRCDSSSPTESVEIPAKGHNYNTEGTCLNCSNYDYLHDQGITTRLELLTVLIKEADENVTNKETYTEETWKLFEAALNEAKEEIGKKSYSHSDVNLLTSLYERLSRAKNSLVKKEVEVKVKEPTTKEEAKLSVAPQNPPNISVSISGSGDSNQSIPDNHSKSVKSGKKVITVSGYDKNQYSFIKWLVKFGEDSVSANTVRIMEVTDEYKEYPSETLTLDVNDSVTVKPVFVNKTDSVKVTLNVNPLNSATVKYKDEVFDSTDNPLGVPINVVKNDTLNLETQQIAGFNGSFTGWSSSSGNVSFTSPNSLITNVTIGSDDASITANFKTNQQSNPNSNPLYSVNSSASPAEGGKVSGGGYYNPGTLLTIYATPNEGYEFVNWTLNGNEVTKDSTLKVTVTTNELYVANFKKIEIKPTQPDSPSEPTNPSTPTQPDTQENLVKVYRLYHDLHKEHLYTTDENEVRVLTTENGWRLEGTGWQAPTEGKPVYRLYSPVTCYHLYTTDENEVNVLTSQAGWQKDFNGAPLFYSGGSIPVYRLYHEAQKVHHLTTDSNEYNVLGASGWNQENVAFYAAK